MLVHSCLLSNGRSLSPLLIDILSAANDPNKVGYGLKTNTLNLAPGAETVQYDPGSFNRHGTKPRAHRHENRPIDFDLVITGSSQADAHAKLGLLEQVARQSAQWSYYQKGAQPRMKWRPVLGTRPYFSRIYQMQVTPPTSYAGVTLASNKIDGVKVRLLCEPDLDEYTRPVFVANAFGSNLNRADSVGTEGVYLTSGNYLTANWQRFVTSTAGAVICWFRAEWLVNDAAVRTLFTFGADQWYAQKQANGDWSVVLLDSGSTYRTLTITQATINSLTWTSNGWYGIYSEFGRAGTGFKAYWLTDGLTLGTAATATAFSGASSGGAYTLASTPASIRIGANSSGAGPLNGEVDSFMCFQTAGFEIPSDTTQMPFTRDVNSLVVQYPGTITNRLDPASTPAAGRLQVYLRHINGNKPAKLDVRVRPTSDTMQRLRLWVTAGRADFNAYPLTFINSVGATVSGSGWAASGAVGNAYDGVNAVMKNSGSSDDGTTAPAWTKAVTISTSATADNNVLDPGAYAVFLRAWTSVAADAVYKVTFTGGSSVSTLTYTVPSPTASAWQLVPMGAVTLPLGGIRPGGSYGFTLGVYAKLSSGSHYLDGVLLLPIDDENLPLQIDVGQVAVSTEQLECYFGERPDVYRVNQSSGNDVPLAASQTGSVPALLPFADCRLFVSVDKYASGNFPTNLETMTTQVDCYLTPKLRTMR